MLHVVLCHLMYKWLWLSEGFVSKQKGHQSACTMVSLSCGPFLVQFVHIFCGTAGEKVAVVNKVGYPHSVPMYSQVTQLSVRK